MIAPIGMVFTESADTRGSTQPKFEAWPKIFRLNREIVITEKLDGTNAAVVVTPEGEVYAQSRTRIITKESDNFGFAQWVHDNAKALAAQLGPGRHFGEWWGRGIQRTYGLDHRRFSLFNTARWIGDALDGYRCLQAPLCHVVPVIGGSTTIASLLPGQILDGLKAHGSMAAKGFMKPEGIVIFHTAANLCFKVTCEGDEKPKSAT